MSGRIPAITMSFVPLAKASAYRLNSQTGMRRDLTVGSVAITPRS